MSNQNQQPPRAAQPQPQQNRDSREAESRDLEMRALAARPETWAPPEHLPTPIFQAGYDYRWVRTATMGEDDPMNVNRQFREGWSPVSVEEQPHMAMAVDANSKHKGSVEVGGLLLCKAPKEFMAKRAQYYNNITKQAQVSVDSNLMKENDPRMPLFREARSKVTFGGGGE